MWHMGEWMGRSLRDVKDLSLVNLLRQKKFRNFEKKIFKPNLWRKFPIFSENFPILKHLPNGRIGRYNHEIWRFVDFSGHFKHFLKNFGRNRFWGQMPVWGLLDQKMAIFGPFSTNVASLWTKCCQGVNTLKTGPGDSKVFKNTKIIPRHQVKPEKSHNSSSKKGRFFPPHLTKWGRPFTSLIPDLIVWESWYASEGLM